MEPIRAGQLRFRVHGPDVGTDEVPASIFAHQLTTLVKALKAADRAVNGGKPAHDYTISKLQTSIPTAILAEKPTMGIQSPLPWGRSGIDAFAECVSAIMIGERSRALEFGSCAKQVSRFSKAGYSEVWTDANSIIRVDTFLAERAKAVFSPEATPIAPPMPANEWFKGAAHGSFDGEIKEVDLRGARPHLKIVLSAGGVQIDCVCKQEHIEAIRSSLNKRARVFGRAIYDGRGGLPRRIEVDEVTPVTEPGDFSLWRGTFEPFPYEAWEGDE